MMSQYPPRERNRNFPSIRKRTFIERRDDVARRAERALHVSHQISHNLVPHPELPIRKQFDQHRCKQRVVRQPDRDRPHRINSGTKIG